MNTDLEKLSEPKRHRPATLEAQSKSAPACPELHDSEPADRMALHRIEAALRKLDEGSYGYCDTCGDKISVQKLSVDPSRTFCGTCAP